MGWKLLTTRTQLANRGLVNEFLNMEPAPHDRPLSEKRLQVYERILRAGEFRPVTWASAACDETNCTYRVNGKHTSTLLSKADPLPAFHVSVERYQCGTLKDVASLYNTFDSRLGSRTTNDINAAFAGTIPELAGVPKRFVNLVVSAAAYQRYGDAERSPAEKAELLVDCWPFAVWLADLLPSTGGRNASGGFLVRAPVVNAMMATYERLPNKSKEFWTLCRDESAADKDDPTRVLARYLVRVVVAGGNSGSSAGRKIAGSREIYVKCLHAWNAWRKGERTALNYHAAAPVPDVSR